MLDPARMDDVLRRGGDVATVVAALEARSTSVGASCRASSTRCAQQRNAANERMAKLDKKSAEFAAARDELKALSTADQGRRGASSRTLETESRAAPAPRSRTRRTRAFPTGTSEADNPVLHTWGDKPTFAFAPKPHWELGEALGILDFEAGARIAGARFTVLRGAASRLTRALINYMLDLHTAARLRRGVAAGDRRGARRCAAPASCRSSRRICSSSTIPVGPRSRRRQRSVPVADRGGPGHEPPRGLRSSSPASCRAATPRTRRASAPRPARRGKDTRGLIRQHQFDKVELVKFDDAGDQLRRARGAAPGRRARAAGPRPSLPRRRRCAPATSASRPRRPTTSRSGCPGRTRIARSRRARTSRTSRRAARRSATARQPGDKPRPVHTLNGSGIAIGRTIVAILEQYQQADGSGRRPGGAAPVRRRSRADRPP